MPGWISHSRAKQSWSFVFNLLDNISAVSTRVCPALHLHWFCTDSFKMTSDLDMVAKQWHYLAKPNGIYSGQHWSLILSASLYYDVYLLTPVLPDVDAKSPPFSTLGYKNDDKPYSRWEKMSGLSHMIFKY